MPIPTFPEADWKMFEFPILFGARNFGTKLVVPLPKTGVGACPNAAAAIVTQKKNTPMLRIFIDIPL